MKKKFAVLTNTTAYQEGGNDFRGGVRNLKENIYPANQYPLLTYNLDCTNSL